RPKRGGCGRHPAEVDDELASSHLVFPRLVERRQRSTPRTRRPRRQGYGLNFTTSGAGFDSAIVSPRPFTVTLYMPTSLTASAGMSACNSLRLTNQVSTSRPLSSTRWNGQKPRPRTVSVVGPSPCTIAGGETSMVGDSCCHELNSGIGFT